ncbi:hypothetical protein CQU01_04460 [Cerasibacillus quisquiliarum]|uniref:Uncharacterized protein n=1 Tax=Cerasibacillus quisquiliarum TaxID=227865 RepID=A0A511UWT2_9BACI|nr:hypothetical protein CQU01_04460 [Cerasibacillus quisquiliarum]
MEIKVNKELFKNSKSRGQRQVPLFGVYSHHQFIDKNRMLAHKPKQGEIDYNINVDS